MLWDMLLPWLPTMHTLLASDPGPPPVVHRRSPRPDTSVQPDGEACPKPACHPSSSWGLHFFLSQGGLDQWTLGHLPVADRLMEGSERSVGMPKAPAPLPCHFTLHEAVWKRNSPEGFARKCPHIGGGGVSSLALAEGPASCHSSFC